MPASRADHPRPRARRLLSLAPAALILQAGAAFAAYPVLVEFRDPNGAVIQVEGKDPSYAFQRRTHFRKALREGEPAFRDEEVRRNSFPLGSRRISFGAIREVRFEWRNLEGAEKLVLRFDLTTGVTEELPASSLEGAEHPIPPSFTLETAGGSLTLPLDPLTPATLRRGRPTLVRIEFTGNTTGRGRGVRP